MNKQAFYLTARSGGFEVYNHNGKLILTVATEEEAQHVVEAMACPYCTIVIANGVFIGAFENDEAAAKAINQLRALHEAVGPTRGSTLH